MTTAAEVAKFFRVSIHTVAQWRRAGMPGVPRRYELDEIVAWREASRKKPPPSADSSDPDVQFKRARAELAWLKVREQKRELIPRREHEDFFISMCGMFRNGLLGMAPTLAAQTGGLNERDRLAVVEDRLRDLLLSISDGEDPGSAEGDAGAGPALDPPPLPALPGGAPSAGEAPPIAMGGEA